MLTGTIPVDGVGHIPQTTLSYTRVSSRSIPTLLRTGSDQVHGTTGGSLANPLSPQPANPTPVRTAWETAGFRRIQTDSCTTHRGPQFRDERSGAHEDIKGGSGDWIARTVPVGVEPESNPIDTCDPSCPPVSDFVCEFLPCVVPHPLSNICLREMGIARASSWSRLKKRRIPEFSQR